MCDASTGVPSTTASDTTFAPPSSLDDSTSALLRAIVRRVSHRGVSPSQRKRGLRASSARARASIAADIAPPTWSTRRREDAGRSREAIAARKGSLTGRRCATTHTSNVDALGGTPGVGRTDWRMERTLGRRCSASSSSPRG